MGTLIQDLKYGLRMLAKNPGFTAVAVITLALGIGANTAIFTVVNAVLLRPLPFKLPDRLVRVGETDLHDAPSIGEVSYPNFLDWRVQNHVFESMAAFHSSSFTLARADEPVLLAGAVVSADLFSLLGVTPTLGRDFLPEEDQPAGGGRGRSVILSYHCWQSRFGTDPRIVGRTIDLDSKSFTIVGVMPNGFKYPISADPVELWTTFAVDAEGAGNKPPATAERSTRYLSVIARLKPNVTLTRARADMAAVARNLEQAYPGPNSSTGAWLIPELNAVGGDRRSTLLVLFGTVAFVLLIACANVANLLLTRTAARHKEIAIRAALGASRPRFVGQVLTETLLLWAVGGSLGVALSVWATEALVKLSPHSIPRLVQASVDLPVLIFALVMSLLTGLLFGLAPALQTSRTEITDSLKEGGTLGGNRRNPVRGALVVLESALAFVLLAGAGLMIQSLSHLSKVDPGFDSHNVLTLRFDLPSARYSAAQRVAFYRQLLSHVQVLPGVSAVAGVEPLPLSNEGMACSFEIQGRPTPKGTYFNTDFITVTPDYFRTMRIPLLSGRGFTARDELTSPPVVIVNETLARRFFPSDEPLGKRIKPAISNGYKEAPLREIVGLVADVRARGLTQASEPQVYVPQAQSPMVMTVVVRTMMDPRGVIDTVRRQVAALDRELPLYDVLTLNQYLAIAVAEPRFNTLLLGLFAGLAVVLAAVGLYGVISYSAVQRSHEIGVRMALGAQRLDVLRLIIGQGMTLALTGVAVGLAGALVLTRVLSSLLYGVRATDPATLIVVSLLLSGVALLASYIPARRATKVDPMVALRYE